MDPLGMIFPHNESCSGQTATPLLSADIGPVVSFALHVPILITLVRILQHV